MVLVLTLIVVSGPGLRQTAIANSFTCECFLVLVLALALAGNGQKISVVRGILYLSLSLFLQLCFSLSLASFFPVTDWRQHRYLQTAGSHRGASNCAA